MLHSFLYMKSIFRPKKIKNYYFIIIFVQELINYIYKPRAYTLICSYDITWSLSYIYNKNPIYPQNVLQIIINIFFAAIKTLKISVLKKKSNKSLGFEKIQI